jgi:hypothetical protein
MNDNGVVSILNRVPFDLHFHALKAHKLKSDVKRLITYLSKKYKIMSNY